MFEKKLSIEVAEIDGVEIYDMDLSEARENKILE